MLSDEELYKSYHKGRKLFLTNQLCPYQRTYEEWQDNWIKDDCARTNEEYRGFIDAWRENKKVPIMKKILQLIGMS